jgi:hypothetical protein
MGLREWLVTFRILHEGARRGKLSAQDRSAYAAQREELARALVAFQRLSLQPGQTPRQAVRVARAIPVDLIVAGESMRAVTRDISIGGFSAILDRTLPAGDEVGYSLRIQGPSPIVGEARIVDVKSIGGRIRGSFALLSLSAEDRERLEMFIFDMVLASLAK